MKQHSNILKGKQVDHSIVIPEANQDIGAQISLLFHFILHSPLNIIV